VRVNKYKRKTNLLLLYSAKKQKLAIEIILSCTVRTEKDVLKLLNAHIQKCKKVSFPKNLAKKLLLQHRLNPFEIIIYTRGELYVNIGSKFIVESFIKMFRPPLKYAQ